MRHPVATRLELNEAASGGADALLPSQFWTALADPRTEPERRLMVAVLEEAMSVVLNGERGDRTVVREAERWFASDDRGAPFTFATICDVLGLDMGRVRQALEVWQRRRRVFRRPRLQAGRGRHQVGTPRRAA
jgi:hypothetical protein